MADSLKVSPTMIKQPAVGRNQTDPQIPFQIKDVTKVNNLNTSKQTSSQNQTLLNSDGPKLLMDILKNPESSTHFLQSLYLLQEISQLVPLDNLSLNEELETIFKSIFLKSDNVLLELLNQSNQTSLFKGELFDWMRDLLSENHGLENNIVLLLKSMNLIKSKPQYKESLINQAHYLLKEFKGLKQEELIKKIIESIESNDQELSGKLNDLIINLEKSLIFQTEMKKNIGIMQYNLSRYLLDLDIEDALLPFKEILKHNFGKFENLVRSYLEIQGKPINSSVVIDRIIQLFEIEIMNSGVLGLTHEKIERIVISILSSPSNFVPLLHFILPVHYENLQTYSEVWIDVKTNSETVNPIHVLMAIEIEKIGHFEIEIWSLNQRIKLELFCPPSVVEYFKPLVISFSKQIMDSSFKLDTVTINPLVKARSLLEVFTHLSETQTGLDIYA